MGIIELRIRRLLRALEAALVGADDLREGKADDEVDEGHQPEDGEDLHRGVVAVHENHAAAHELLQSHGAPQIRRVLDGGHELREQRRHHVAQGLGQDDVQVHLWCREPLGAGGLVLARRHAGQTAADDLGHRGRGEQREGEHRRGQGRQLGHEEREHNPQKQRGVLEQLHVGDGEAAQQAGRGSAHDGDDGAEHDRAGDGQRRDDEGEPEPFQKEADVRPGEQSGDVAHFRASCALVR